jgi:hypothetical protein
VSINALRGSRFLEYDVEDNRRHELAKVAEEGRPPYELRDRVGVRISFTDQTSQLMERFSVVCRHEDLLRIEHRCGSLDPIEYSEPVTVPAREEDTSLARQRVRKPASIR